MQYLTFQELVYIDVFYSNLFRMFYLGASEPDRSAYLCAGGRAPGGVQYRQAVSADKDRSLVPPQIQKHCAVSG